MQTTFQVWHVIEKHLLPATKEKELFLSDCLMRLKKGSTIIDEYIKTFDSICNNLCAIGEPVNDLDNCFHLSHGLGHKYQDFRLAILSKALYPTFTQFILAIKSHE